MKKNNDYLIKSRELTIENTTSCGANCIMCPRDKYSFKWGHMETEFYKDIIDQAIELGMLSLDACGFGDPLIDPKFEEKIAYVKKNYPQVKIYISTTAQMLDEKRLEWVCRYVDTMKVSHYGFSKNIFESIHRGSLQYEKILKNLESLLTMAKTKRPYVIMQFLVFPENKHQIEDWRMYWEPKAEEVMIWLPHNCGGGLEPINVSPDKNSPKSCGRPFVGNLFVRENGEVSMCCYDFNRQLIIGNLHQQLLKEVLTGEALQKIRKVHQKGQFDTCNLICKNCDQIYSRDHALIYASNQTRKAGVLNSHPDLINDMLTREQNLAVDPNVWKA